MGSNVIGDLQVQISGDYSKLSDDLAQSVIAAEVGGQKIASAFTTAAGGTDDWTEALGRSRAATQEEVNAIGQAADQLSKYGISVENVLGPERDQLDVLQQMPKSYTEMTVAQQRSIETLNQQVTASEASRDSLSKLTGGALDFSSALKLLGVDLSARGLISLAADALEAFNSLEKANLALTALTGSSGTAARSIQEVINVAQDDALALPQVLQAEQKLVAFGVQANLTSGILRTVADSAAATGNNFNTVANSFERIIESGMVQSRTLVQLGINLKDLADAMGVTEGEAKKAFAALDQEDRIIALETALTKFRGTAEAVAGSIGGQWQKLATDFELASAKIGSALEKPASLLIATVRKMLQETNTEVSNWANVWRDVIIVFGEITGKDVPAMKDALDALSAQTQKSTAAEATRSDQFKKGWDESTRVMSEGALAIIAKQQDLDAAANKALQTLKDVQAARKLGLASQDDETRALVEYRKALDEANVKLKEHKIALDDVDKLLLGVETATKKAYDSVAVYNDIVGAFGHDSLQAAAAQREMLSALKAVGLQAGDTEPALAKVGAAFEVIKAHTKDWNPELQKLIDELGRFPTLSEQIAAGLTVIVSQTDKTRDAFGFLKGASTAAYQAMIDGGKNGVEVMLNLSDAVTSGGQVIASGMSPAVAAMKSFTAAAEEAVAAFGDLSSSALSFGSQLGIGTGGTSAPGGRGKKGLGGAFNLSNPYWDLGTPDQIEAAFQDTLASVKFTDRQMEDYFYQAQFQLEQAALANYYRQHPFGAETPSSATPPRSTTAAGSAPAAAPTSAPISPALQYFLNQGISLDQIGSLDTSLQNLNATVANASTAIAGSFAALTPVIQQATTQIAASVQQQAASFSRLSDVLAPVNAPATASGPPASFMALGGNSPTSGPVTYGASNIVNIGNIALQPDEAHLLDLMTVILQRRGVRF